MVVKWPNSKVVSFELNKSIHRLLEGFCYGSIIYIGESSLSFSFVLEVPGKEIKRNKIVALTDD